MLRYAPRIQELTLDEDALSLKILQSSWFRTTLLLPNLRKLHWRYNDYTVLTSIRLLLNPSLVHLHVPQKIGNNASVLAFLESFHTFSPNIKSLQIHHASDLATMVSRVISRLPNLEFLDCNYIDEAALIHVSRSRRLQKFCSILFYHQPDGLEQIAGYGTPDRSPFENVRFLDLKLGDLASIIPCLKAHHQPFEEVSFEIYRFTPPKAFHDFFAALSSVTRRRTLRRITLSATYWTLEEALKCDDLVDFQVLSPLATLNLDKLDVDIKVPISLNDDELVQLVQGWPRLECLSLNRYAGWYFVPSLQFPTLRGLSLVLARCPKLSELALSWDATNIPSLSDEEASVRNTAITKFAVACSPIGGPTARVARFLLERLPSLVEIPTSVYPRMWMKVDSANMHMKDSALTSMWRKVEWHIQRIRGLECSSSEFSESETGTEDILERMH